MTPVVFTLALVALTILAFRMRELIVAMLSALVLLLQFVLCWILAACSLAFAVYCLAGYSAMPLLRILGIGALLFGLCCLGSGVGLFGSMSPAMQDTTLGARFATRRDLRRAKLLKKSLDA